MIMMIGTRKKMMRKRWGGWEEVMSEGTIFVLKKLRYAL